MTRYYPLEIKESYATDWLYKKLWSIKRPENSREYYWFPPNAKYDKGYTLKEAVELQMIWESK
jgi:hypothetical protein